MKYAPLESVFPTNSKNFVKPRIVDQKNSAILDFVLQIRSEKMFKHVMIRFVNPGIFVLMENVSRL